MKKILFACAIAMLCMAVSCPKPITIVRRGVAALELGALAFKTDLIQWHTAHLIDNHQYTEGMKVVDGLLAEDGIIKQAKDVLSRIDSLDPQAKRDLFTVLGPLQDALNPERMPWIESIGDPDTRKGVRLAVLAMRQTVFGFRVYLLFSPQEQQ